MDSIQVAHHDAILRNEEELYCSTHSFEIKCYEHVQLMATKSKNIIKLQKLTFDIPLSPYAYHFQLMISIFHTNTKTTRNRITTSKQEEEPETNYDKQEDSLPLEQEAELPPEPPD